MNIQFGSMKPLLNIFVVAISCALSPQSLALSLTEVAKLTASDGEAYEGFGWSVSIDDDTAIIGTRDNRGPKYADAAYVFVRTGDIWSEQAKLTASDDSKNPEFFGWAVSVDSDTAVVGAISVEDEFGFPRGAAYVLVRTDGVWTEQAKLMASDVDIFGISVSVDDDTAVIGGILDDQPGDDGSAYVFVRDDGIWTEQAILKPSSSTGEDQGEEVFGKAVAIDSDTIVVGGGYDFDDHNPIAYVFTRTNGEWTEQAKLKANDSEALNGFGETVSLDGDTVVIGAPRDDVNGDDSGSAYVFVRSNNSWTQQAKLSASDSEAGLYFGVSVSVADNKIVVGAPSYLGPTEAAYVFERTDSIWTEQAKLKAGDGENGDTFGRSVAVDAATVVVGAYEDSDKGDESGSAYLFTIPNTVLIDIKTSKKPENVINLKSDKNLKVTIFGTADFDALQVDPSTVKFGPSEASPIRHKGKDYNKDGFSDLILTFKLEETGISCGDTEATLTGKTLPDPVIYIAGTDSFTVEPCP